MTSLLLALSLPCLLWTQGPDTAPALKEAGVARVCLPAETAPDVADAWRATGLTVRVLTQAESAAREVLPTPGIVSNAGVASPTRAPFVAANGWRFQRARAAGKAGARTGKDAASSGRTGANGGAAAGRGAKTGDDGNAATAEAYAYQVPAGRGAIAAAEAFAYGVDAVLTVDPADLPAVGRLLASLPELAARELPDVADFAVVDDGSPITGEVMNLLARRNLLFQILAPGAASRGRTRQWPVVVQLGTKAWPVEQAADPSAFALKVRRQLTDVRRSLRIYGSEVVIARLTSANGRVRLHLLNYGGREIAGLRVRLRGHYREDAAWSAGDGTITPTDYARTADATELTLPRLGVYAVIDLVAER